MTSYDAGTPPPKPAEIWKTGLVACYHGRRLDLGMGWEKCATCLYFRQRRDEYWPPSRPPGPSDSS